MPKKVPNSYKVEKIRFTPDMMNNPPSAVVNLRVNFIGRKDGLINAWFARFSFNSSGQLVGSPNNKMLTVCTAY